MHTDTARLHQQWKAAVCGLPTRSGDIHYLKVLNYLQELLPLAYSTADDHSVVSGDRLRLRSRLIPGTSTSLNVLLSTYCHVIFI
jgi:hypothetical protein